jgi:hypothetical protein
VVDRRLCLEVVAQSKPWWDALPSERPAGVIYDLSDVEPAALAAPSVAGGCMQVSRGALPDAGVASASRGDRCA